MRLTISELEARRPALLTVVVARREERPWLLTRPRETTACVWLNAANASEVEAAYAYARAEGMTVCLYPTTEARPLERARARVMAGHAPRRGYPLH